MQSIESDQISAKIGQGAHAVVVGKDVLQQIIYQEAPGESIPWYREFSRFFWGKKTWKRYCKEFALSLAKQEGVDREFSELMTYLSPSDLPILVQSGEYKLSEIIEIIEGFAQPRVILLGEPGCGKTTSLKHLAMEQAKKTVRSLQRFRIPVFASLGSYTGGNILSFISDKIVGYKSNILDGFIPSYLSKGRFIIFFDALNEMPGEQYEENIKTLKHLMETYPLNRYVFSCRSDNYNGELEIPGAVIKPLDDEMIRDFMIRYLENQGNELYEELLNENLLDMVRNPFFLLMVLKTRNVPKCKGKMVEHFVETLLRREKSKGNIYRSYCWVPGKDLKIAFESFAFQMMENYQTTVISKDEATKFLEQYYKADSRCDYLSQGCEVLILRYTDDRKRNISFWHQIIQEYFAASYLEKKFNELDEGYIDRICNDQWWWESLILMSGLVEESHKFITSILGKNPGIERLQLAAAILYNSGITEEEHKESILKRVLDIYREPLPIKSKEIMVKLIKLAGKQFLIDFASRLPLDDDEANETIIQILIGVGGIDVVNIFLDFLCIHDAKFESFKPLILKQKSSDNAYSLVSSEYVEKIKADSNVKNLLKALILEFQHLTETNFFSEVRKMRMELAKDKLVIVGGKLRSDSDKVDTFKVKFLFDYSRDSISKVRLQILKEEAVFLLESRVINALEIKPSAKDKNRRSFVDDVLTINEEKLEEETAKIIAEFLEKKRIQYLLKIIKKELPKLGQFIVKPIIQRFISQSSRPKPKYEDDIENLIAPPVFIEDDIKNLIVNVGDSAVENLTQLLIPNGNNRELQLSIINILGEFNHPIGLEMLCRHLGSKDVGLRAEAVKSLKRIGGDEVVAAVGGILGEKEWQKRLAAVEILGDFDNDSALKLIEKAAQDTNIEVRNAADFFLNKKWKTGQVSWARSLLYNPFSALKRFREIVNDAKVTIEEEIEKYESTDISGYLDEIDQLKPLIMEDAVFNDKSLEINDAPLDRDIDELPQLKPFIMKDAEFNGKKLEIDDALLEIGEEIDKITGESEIDISTVKSNNDINKENEKSFFWHLDELRKRLLYGLGSIWPFFIFVFLFFEPLVEPFINWTYSIPQTDEPIPWFIRLPISMDIAILLVIPMFIFQVWLFLSPAFYRSEKSKIIAWIFMTLGAFLLLFLLSFLLSKILLNITGYTVPGVAERYTVINRLIRGIIILIIGILIWLFLKYAKRIPILYDTISFIVIFLFGSIAKLILGKERIQTLKLFLGKELTDRLLKKFPYKWITIFFIIFSPHIYIPLIITVMMSFLIFFNAFDLPEGTKWPVKIIRMKLGIEDIPGSEELLEKLKVVSYRFKLLWGSSYAVALLLVILFYPGILNIFEHIYDLYDLNELSSIFGSFTGRAILFLNIGFFVTYLVLVLGVWGFIKEYNLYKREKKILRIIVTILLGIPFSVISLAAIYNRLLSDIITNNAMIITVASKTALFSVLLVTFLLASIYIVKWDFFSSTLRKFLLALSMPGLLLIFLCPLWFLVLFANIMLLWITKIIKDLIKVIEKRREHERPSSNLC